MIFKRIELESSVILTLDWHFHLQVFDLIVP